MDHEAAGFAGQGGYPVTTSPCARQCCKCKRCARLFRTVSVSGHVNALLALTIAVRFCESRDKSSWIGAGRGDGAATFVWGLWVCMLIMASFVLHTTTPALGHQQLWYPCGSVGGWHWCRYARSRANEMEHVHLQSRRGTGLRNLLVIPLWLLLWCLLPTSGHHGVAARCFLLVWDAGALGTDLHTPLPVPSTHRHIDSCKRPSMTDVTGYYALPQWPKTVYLGTSPRCARCSRKQCNCGACVIITISLQYRTRTCTAALRFLVLRV